MAISIELCVNGVVVDGFDVWWDEMDSALDVATNNYPLLERVDAYGDVEFTLSELGLLNAKFGAWRRIRGATGVAGKVGDACDCRSRCRQVRSPLLGRLIAEVTIATECGTRVFT